LKLRHGIIVMLETTKFWIIVLVVFIVLNHLAWIERVEWLRSLP